MPLTEKAATALMMVAIAGAGPVVSGVAFPRNDGGTEGSGTCDEQGRGLHLFLSRCSHRWSRCSCAETMRRFNLARDYTVRLLTRPSHDAMVRISAIGIDDEVARAASAIEDPSGLGRLNPSGRATETRRIAQREMGLILPSVEAVIPPQEFVWDCEAVSQAGSSHLRAQAHLRHRSLDQVREDGSRLLHGRRRDIGAERIAQTRTSALA